MSREVRRVPVDFDWPLNEVWRGYLMPEEVQLPTCPTCNGQGDSPEGKRLHDRWYGYVPFHPRERGSIPLTPETPAVRAFAERNVARSPDFYGTGEFWIYQEARRLANLWNGQWCHHLNQADVDALVAEGRLKDFTHHWTKGEGWKPKDPPYRPTAAEVNEWSLRGLGHDSINAWIVIDAELDRRGLPKRCATCGGSGDVGTEEQRAASEEWEPTPPPTGEGYQLWETVSEGSPISPVFPDREGLIHWLTTEYRQVVNDQPLTRAQAEAFVTEGSSLCSFVISDGQMMSGEAAVEELSQ